MKLFPLGDNQAIEVADSPADIREQIYELERAMKAAPEEIKCNPEPVHHFAKGIYAREVTIPAGTIVVGEVHKTEHLCIVSKGKITVLTEQGLKTIEAPCTIVSPPGTKRVGVTHTETVWTAIHGTNETDIEKLKTELIAETHEELSEAAIERLSKLVGG